MELLTYRGTAQRLGVSVRTVYRLVDAGELERIYVLNASQPRVTGQSVDQYIRRQARLSRRKVPTPVAVA